MRRINKNIVQLDQHEMDMLNMFDALLSDGFGIQAAATDAITTYLRNHPEYVDTISGEFIRYISEDTLRWRPISRTLIAHDS